MQITRRLAVAGLMAATLATPPLAQADEAERMEIDAKANAALARLYAENPAAKELGGKSVGILIMPEITKAGFVVGGQGGKGVLRVGGAPQAYYRLVSASIGFQAGVQSYSQVLMFLTKEALDGFTSANGWEAGVDGSVAIVKSGATVGGDTTTVSSPIVGFVFGEKGLMAAANIEGSKYTRLDD
ncbi:YSC84-related protein [Albimonas sp. CAU 1670]|uniref:lipid-binding SYLF domain-containing protein n=1 Tax=Albimonas sp. CAU 1670 TaxID=3032599 RepID=UPI0023DA6E37|nr:YSC84-related protein [Albimonas sp. CAU 1670]MDF2235358.1 YSC84-related protein [Albimonas sp. CAU 1670]